MDAKAQRELWIAKVTHPSQNKHITSVFKRVEVDLHLSLEPWTVFSANAFLRDTKSPLTLCRKAMVSLSP